MFRALVPVLTPLLLAAQSAAPPAPPGKEPAGPKAGMRQELILARLHRLRMERLQQALGLSQDKAKVIADRWETFDLDGQARRQKMRLIRQQVNTILLSSLSEEEKNARMRPLVDQYAALRLEQNEAKRKFEDDITATLSPAQQGRFIIVVEEIQRAVMDAIHEQRGGDPSGAGF